MTSKFEVDLDRVKVNQRTRQIGLSRSKVIRSKAIVRAQTDRHTDTHAQRTDRFTRTTLKTYWSVIVIVGLNGWRSAESRRIVQ